MKRPLLHLILAALLVVPAAVLVMWLLGGAATMAYWSRTGLAAAVAVGAGAVAAILIPPPAGGLRFAAAVVSLAVGWKLYDLHRSPGRGLGMGFVEYLTYLPNWFWFVCRRPPPHPPASQDLRRVAVAA